MLRLIILLPTWISRINLSLLSISTKALVVNMSTNSNSWTAVTWSGVLIESYTFLFYYLWLLFLILNIEILTLLWILSFLAITNVLLQHIVDISHVVLVNLFVISSHLISQSAKTERSWGMWSGTLLLVDAVVGNGVRSLCWWLDR